MSESRAPAPRDARLRIFISYRRQDAAPYAGRLYDDLETGRGVPPAELVRQLLDACSESPPSSN